MNLSERSVNKKSFSEVNTKENTIMNSLLLFTLYLLVPCYIEKFLNKLKSIRNMDLYDGCLCDAYLDIYKRRNLLYFSIIILFITYFFNFIYFGIVFVIYTIYLYLESCYEWFIIINFSKKLKIQ